MNITTGQFNDSYFPIMDGVGITAHNYARWLNEKYGTSILVAPKVSKYKDMVPYKVHRFRSVMLPGMNPYRVGLPAVDFKFKKKIKKIGFDLVHAHCPFISGQLAASIARKQNIPLVATFHTKYRDDYKKIFNNELFVDFLLKVTLDFYSKADLVWVPNKATGKTLTEYGFTGKYEVMQNGTDLVLPEKPKLIKYRKKGLDMIGAGPDEFIMLFIGQHRWEKNVRMIIDSLRLLKAHGDNFKMVFVGEGYAAGDMKKLVRNYKLQNDVIFLGVLVDRQSVQHVLAAADLFVFPSVYDNSPLVIQETAAFGIPSILAKNTSAAENVLDGINGFLVSNEAQDLANKISILIDNHDILKKAGEGARKSLYHPWESIVDDVYERYMDLLKSFHSKVPEQNKSGKPRKKRTTED